MASMKAFTESFDFALPGWHNLYLDCMVLRIEPRRLWPYMTFAVSAANTLPDAPETICMSGYETWTEWADRAWRGWIRVPYVMLHVDPLHPGPLRINVIRRIPARRGTPGDCEISWIERRPPSGYVNRHWPDDPAHLGWLFVEGT